jgi:hypothetical protein
MPELDITPERSEEMIEKIASFIVDKGMETPAIIALETTKPVAYIGSQMGLFMFSAFLPLIPQDWGFNLVALFRERGNIEKIIKRIEAKVEAAKEQEESEKAKKKEAAKEQPQKQGIRERLVKFFKG